MLLNAYSRDLERKRLNAGAAGISLTDSECFKSVMCNLCTKVSVYSVDEDTDDAYDDSDESSSEFEGSESELSD